MSKLDLRKKMATRKGKAISAFAYKCLMNFVLSPFLKRPMNVEIVDNVGVKNIKEQFIVVANHTSRCDYIYVVSAFYPIKLNFMAAYCEFFRKHLHFIFDIMHVIPKRNFTADMHTIKELKQVVKDGGNIAFFPEGKSSISGTNQPCMIGTGKLIKHMRMPVYCVNIKGGYMSNTQWNIAVRSGKVVVTLDKLFTPEEIDNLSPEEIERKMDKAIYNDDFEWNKTMRIKYKGNETVANKLEEHLFRCPKCGSEFEMKGEGNKIVCTHCGNGATINDYYDLVPLDKDCVIPKTIRVWYELQRRAVYREIKSNPDFCMEEEVTLGMLPNDHYIDKQYTAEIVGKGKIKLTTNEFSFVGEKNGEPFEFHNDVLNVPTLILETDSSYFGTYYEGEYYEFTPSRPVVTKWVLATEECHRLKGGKWQNTLPQQQWIYADDKPSDKEDYYL